MSEHSRSGVASASFTTYTHAAPGANTNWGNSTTGPAADVPAGDVPADDVPADDVPFEIGPEPRPDDHEGRP